MKINRKKRNVFSLILGTIFFVMMCSPVFSQNRNTLQKHAKAAGFDLLLSADPNVFPSSDASTEKPATGSVVTAEPSAATTTLPSKAPASVQDQGITPAPPVRTSTPATNTPAVSTDQKNPSNTEAYIVVSTLDGKKLNMIYQSAGVLNKYHLPTKKLKGLSYNAGKNLLTINGFKKSTLLINAHAMGSGFKIKLKGKKNKALAIFSSAGDTGYNGSISLTGTGKITLNAKRTGKVGLVLDAKKTNSKISIAKKTKLVSYGNTKLPAIEVLNSRTKSKRISIKGEKSTGKIIVKKTSGNYIHYWNHTKITKK